MVAAATAAPTSSSFTSVYNPTVYFQANLLGKGLALAFPGRRTRLDFLPRFRIAHSSLVDNNSAGSILEAAAKRTVNTFIKTGMVVGLGSGAGSRLAIQYLGQQLRLGNIKDIVGIPTSVDSASEAAKAGIPLDQYQDNFQIDFAFSDAEAIEEGTLISVIGRRRLQGEESIVQEKLTGLYSLQRKHSTKPMWMAQFQSL
ncbi:Ribose-5-phosphate isomerase [Bertholletia excelsa]